MGNNSRLYDCIILGSGLGGSILGAILARRGLEVLLLDAGTHPRFAIGESTTPDTSFRIKLLSLKYCVPELMNLGTFHHLRDHVSPAGGVKRAFSFLYHREGEEQNPLESHQYPTLAPPMGPDCHFFRQDTDAYMLSIAVGYGATVRQQTRAAEIEFDDESVRLTSDRGEVFKGRYLVDAAGFRSPLAEKFELREDPEVLRTNSRTIFTHMLGVKHYDLVAQPPHEYGLKYPFSQSTLHHVFEGGWFWIIPFNNHHDAVNPLCSVGLVLNRELHPETGMDAEEEFFHYVGKFPAIIRQFEGARAVRNWVSTGRMNYCSKRLTGHRYCLLAHAAGFIDPFFSSGLNLTMGHIDILAKHLIRAFEDDDFAVERFEEVNDFYQTALRHFDEWTASAFVSFRDYQLWDAWFRVWVIGLLIGTCLKASLFLRYFETGERSLLDDSERSPHTGVLGSGFAEHRRIFEEARARVERVRDGQLGPHDAARQIRALYESVDFVPTYFRWHRPEVRTTPAFTVWGITKMYVWYLLRSPRRVKKLLFAWHPFTGYRFVLQSIRKSGSSSRRRKYQYLRDTFKAWNRDWHPQSQG